MRTAAGSINRSERGMCQSTITLLKRELRSPVIGREISFGSQSEDGAKRRGILMTILYSLKRHTKDIREEILDLIAEGKREGFYYLLSLIFTSSPHHK
ncbi:MAG: hypothetical protein ACP5QK_11140 [Myxococcota bacterium]